MSIEENWATPRGSVSCLHPAPSVVLIRLAGHLEASFAERIRQSVEAILDAGHQPHLFFDAWEATSLETRFRTQLTPWHKEIHSKVKSQNVLVKSKIVAMAISVANMAVGHIIKPYNKRHEFEAAIEAAQR